MKSQHWIDALEKVNNNQHYLNAIHLSQRIQLKLNQLQQYKEDDDDYLLQTSPTETIIAYYDVPNTKTIDRDKSLPNLITSQHSSSATMMQYDELPPEDKSLPSIKSSLYQSKVVFDSAVDLYLNGKEDHIYPNNKPLPSIQYNNNNNSNNNNNKIKNTPIIHTKKKYYGLKGLITRTYQLNNIIVTRSTLSYSYFVKLLASYDKVTGEKKAVLKVTLTSSHKNTNNLFIIPYFDFTFYHHLHQSLTNKKSQKLIDTPLVHIPDSQIQSALFIWLNYYHHQLPSIHHVSHILRQGLVVYIVYCI